MQRMTALTLIAAQAALCLCGCGDDDEAGAAEPAPPLGALELPISHRHADPAPSNAIQIETTPSALSIDGRKLLGLERGRLAAGTFANMVITELQHAIQAGAARNVAALRIHVNTPYQTLALVLGTLKASNVNQFAFEVRPGPGAETGWMKFTDFRVGAPSEEPVSFEGNGQRRWTDFSDHWQAIYEGCRRADYVDCAYLPQVVAPDGLVEIKLWARGAGLKLEFTRFGGTDLTAPAGTGPALIEGVPPPQPGEEAPPEPAVYGAFTWRFRAATAELSPITDATRPVCGAQPCAVVVASDADALAMNLITFMGAAFPNGTEAPTTHWVVP